VGGTFGRHQVFSPNKPNPRKKDDVAAAT